MLYGLAWLGLDLSQNITPPRAPCGAKKKNFRRKGGNGSINKRRKRRKVLFPPANWRGEGERIISRKKLTDKKKGKRVF